MSYILTRYIPMDIKIRPTTFYRVILFVKNSHLRMCYCPWYLSLKFKTDSFVVYNWKSVNCTNTHHAIFLTFPHWLESKYIMGHYTKIFYMQYRFISHYQCNDDFLISRELMYFRFLEFMPISFQLVFPFISFYTICTIAKCFENRFVSSIWTF